MESNDFVSLKEMYMKKNIKICKKNSSHVAKQNTLDRGKLCSPDFSRDFFSSVTATDDKSILSSSDATEHMCDSAQVRQKSNLREGGGGGGYTFSEGGR